MESTNIKIDPFTGKEYSAIIKVKCDCYCHEPNSNMIHAFACCQNGFRDKYIYVEK